MQKLVSMFVILVFGSACGVNFYSSFASQETDEFYLEQAQISLNNTDYVSAAKQLAKVKADSSEKLFLQVSVVLGQAGLSFWQILVDLIESATTSTSGSGVDKLFNSIGASVFGTGTDRVAKTAALRAAIDMLRGSSSLYSKAENFGCFLSGILVLPRIEDSVSAIDGVTTAFATVDSGTGTCSDTDSLNSAVSQLSAVQSDMSLIMAQTSSCRILSFLSQSGSELNTVTSALKKLTDNGDLGCAANTCSGDLCDELQVSCVQSALGADQPGNGVAGDGRVDACEFMQHCQTAGTCL